MCLDAVTAQQQHLIDSQAAGDTAAAGSSHSSLQERLAVNAMQSITNAAEYPPCKVDLRRAPQLPTIAGLAQHPAAAPLVQAAAQHVVQMAGAGQEAAGGAAP